jgi:K+/H+ antiporter YhaU regulatory subunit KhtT
MMDKITIRQRIKYNVNVMMSKGSVFMIFVLFFLTMFAVLLIAFLALIILKNSGNEFGKTLWETFLNILDPGTIAGIENTSGYLVFMTIATIMGLVMTSILIGLVTAGFQAKLEEMQRGKSKVIVSNHTLILGWDNTIFTIISELLIANENVRRPHIVIMADRDITSMHDELRNYLPSFKNTKIVFRRGCLYEINDLKMCNITKSKSVIILEEDDAQKIKVLMAMSNTDFFDNPKNHAVVLLEEKANFEVVEIIGGDNIIAIDLGDTVSKMIAQTATQPGLVAVYKDLISFTGDEIYFNQFTEAIGKTISELLFCFEKSSVIGIQKGENCYLHPDLETKIEEGDSIILITEDDDTAKFTIKDYEIYEDCIVKEAALTAHLKENILIIGYNETVEPILREFEGYLSSDSKVIQYLPVGVKPDESLVKVISESSLDIKIMNGNIPDADAFRSLIEQGFTRIVLVSSECKEEHRTDCDVLLSLIYLRQISDMLKIKLSIIGEITDVKNSEIAKSTRYHDFIVSSNICGMVSTQLSENRYLKPILDDIFDEEGSEIYTKPVEDYVKCNREINYATLLHSAMLKGEICIGYMLYDGENYEYVMNPAKTKRIRFKNEDCVIVVAED